MAIFSKKQNQAEDQKEEKTSEVKAASSDFVISLPLALIQPRISEKAGMLAKLNKYVFLVKRKTNKVEVKKAVEGKYKVKVTMVNMINNLGKTRNVGRMAGRTSDFKKAIVTLKKGDAIKGLTDVI